MFMRLAQVVYTVTQFDTVKSVRFHLDGEPVDVFSGEGIVLDKPVDAEGLRGAAGRRSSSRLPRRGDSTVSSPFTVSGTRQRLRGERDARPPRREGQGARPHLHDGHVRDRLPGRLLDASFATRSPAAQIGHAGRAGRRRGRRRSAEPLGRGPRTARAVNARLVAVALCAAGLLSACGAEEPDGRSAQSPTQAATSRPTRLPRASRPSARRSSSVDCTPANAPGYRLCERGRYYWCPPGPRCDQGSWLPRWTRATIERASNGRWVRVAAQPVRLFRDQVVGHWVEAWLSPDGKTLLAQWSGECESPSTYFVDARGGRPSYVTGERDPVKQPESDRPRVERGRARPRFAPPGCLRRRPSQAREVPDRPENPQPRVRGPLVPS